VISVRPAHPSDWEEQPQAIRGYLPSEDGSMLPVSTMAVNVACPCPVCSKPL
jgi:hypothetical protein